MTKREDLLQLWVQMLQTQRECLQAVECTTLQAGLPLAIYEILYRLSRAPLHRLRMRALASTVLLTPSGLSRAVEKGEQMGLLERRHDEADERGRFCHLKPKGVELLKRVQPMFFAALEGTFDKALNASEVQTLTKLLCAISSAQSKR